MMMQKLPFFEELEGSESVLLAGAGGGFDIFGALPLYAALRAERKAVHLASLSFSFPDTAFPLLALSKEWKERMPAPGIVAVDADTPEIGPYFPELHLARWFRERGEEVTIWCFPVSGVKPLAANYRWLKERLCLDAVVLVDGGSDSLLRGNEDNLGTPCEDVASLVAADSLDLPVKLLACIGFGVDWFHGVSHGRVLEATADLATAGGFLGLFSLLKEMEEAEFYRSACSFVFERMPWNKSIVSSSILSALDGHFGDWHSTERTSKGKLFISPLMSAYWCYRLSAVTRRLLYPAEALAATVSVMDMARLIASYRSGTAIRQREVIPI